MQAYINGLGLVSAQETWKENKFSSSIVEKSGSYLKAIEPDYSNYIDARAARRMGRILKMGYYAARRCMDDAALSPDAILTGTGLGIIDDTEKFLNSILETNEQFVNPTPFIQSTHNTIGGQIALHLKCHGYNHTYVQKGISFESALTDALLLLHENPSQNILCGGFDENSDEHYQITRRVGLWKDSLASNLQLLSSGTTGTIWGEGAGFFMLSGNKTDRTYARLMGVKAWYTGNIGWDAAVHIPGFLATLGLSIKDVDTLISGRNGDIRFDGLYTTVEQLLHGAVKCAYKPLSGDFYTSTIYAHWLSALMVSGQGIPSVLSDGPVANIAPRNVLVYNHWFGRYHTLSLISAA